MKVWVERTIERQIGHVSSVFSKRAGMRDRESVRTTDVMCVHAKRKTCARTAGLPPQDVKDSRVPATGCRSARHVREQQDSRHRMSRAANVSTHVAGRGRERGRARARV